MQNSVMALRFLSEEMLQLLDEQIFLMSNWKWIALAVAIVGGFLSRPVFQFVIRKIREQFRRHQIVAGFVQYTMDRNLEGPLSWIGVSLIWLALFDAIHLPDGLNKYLSLFVKILLTFHLIRLLYVAIEAVGEVLTALARKTENTLDDQLAPLVTKTMKVLVVVLGVLVALQNFGVNVASLLAGLGLGGLAFALAAQDTAANLFGSVTILLDNPFKVGDWIKVGDTEGTVEEIGFRSTRIRTFYNSLVSMPNSTIAKEKVDNMGARGRRRLRQVFGLVYSTPPEKINQFCDSLREMLRNTPPVDPQDIWVNFGNFNSSSLDVVMTCHLLTRNGLEEVTCTQKILNSVLQIARDLKVEFAFPTQTVLATLNPPGPGEHQTADEISP